MARRILNLILAKVREAVRHFREAPVWLEEGDGEEAAGSQETRPGREEAGVESAEAETGGNAVNEGGRAGTDDFGMAEDERAGTGPSPETGAGPEGTAGLEDAGTAIGTEASSTPDPSPSEMDAAARPAGTRPPEAGGEDEGAGAQAGRSAAGAGDWDTPALRRELVRMVLEVMAEREMAEARREISQEAEGRMAAMESRLARLEERGRMNREGA